MNWLPALVSPVCTSEHETVPRFGAPLPPLLLLAPPEDPPVDPSAELDEPLPDDEHAATDANASTTTATRS
jgi:hypothetical protein